MDYRSPPNRRWPDHHHPRDIFAFEKEKRDELQFFHSIQFDSMDEWMNDDDDGDDDDRCGFERRSHGSVRNETPTRATDEPELATFFEWTASRQRLTRR